MVRNAFSRTLRSFDCKKLTYFPCVNSCSSPFSSLTVGKFQVGVIEHPKRARTGAARFGELRQNFLDFAASRMSALAFQSLEIISVEFQAVFFVYHARQIVGRESSGFRAESNEVAAARRLYKPLMRSLRA